ncbi:MAG: O-antigen ligase family protein [Verrucomicrobiota bacterium]
MPTFIDKHGNIDYFGKLSWGNLIDWLITLCLGITVISAVVLFGAVRLETQLFLLPLFSALLVLHALWFFVEKEDSRRLNLTPLLFIPFVVWAAVSSAFITPVPWLGWLEWVAIIEVFIFFWVFSNNVRTRAHLWTLLILSASPAAYATFLGFYQFFQSPDKMANAYTEYGLRLDEQFLGQATGSFGDPNSFAIFLLTLLPCFVIAGMVPRLPRILRVLCVYIAAMFVASLFFTRLVWPLVVLTISTGFVSCFISPKTKRRMIFTLVGASFILVTAFSLFSFSPEQKAAFEGAVTVEGEAVRLVLTQKAVDIFLNNSIVGAGGGSFRYHFEQSSDRALSALPSTPHNDYLLVASNYGGIGMLLLFGPALLCVIVGYRAWRSTPFKIKLKGKKGTTMPSQRFFLSIGISSVLVFSLCVFCSFVLYVPALPLYGALFFGVMTKSAFSHPITLPGSISFKALYAALIVLAAVGFHQFASPKIAAQAKVIRADERLAQILERMIHVSGDTKLLDDVILQYEEAVGLDPVNCDAWLGLSAATCQLYYRNPSKSYEIGKQALGYAEKALDISKDYWRPWAQVGIAHALKGELASSRESLSKAVQLAPNSSNANLYWATFLASSPENRELAITAVERALEINPENAAARRLQQKLLIL